MPLRVPLLVPGFAPGDDGNGAATLARAAGRHERPMSPVAGLAATRALLGLTVAGGFAGAGYLRHDLQAGLLAGAQWGSVAFTVSLASALVERRRISRAARAVGDQAAALAVAGAPAEQAVPALLANRRADAVTLRVAKRQAVFRKESLPTIQLLNRVALLRGLL